MRTRMTVAVFLSSPASSLPQAGTLSTPPVANVPSVNVPGQWPLKRTAALIDGTPAPHDRETPDRGADSRTDRFSPWGAVARARERSPPGPRPWVDLTRQGP